MSKIVCVCAGHDFINVGARGCGYKEEVLAVKLRDRIYNALVAASIQTLRDGVEGGNYSLRKAIHIANKADIAIDIHFNASENPAATGIEALAYSSNEKLCQDLCEAIAKVTGITLRGDKGYKDSHSGHHSKLGFCEAGGIVLEICFISNPSDMKKYVENKLAVAEALAEVLIKWANN